jgi:error-prone DNA polymerase
MSPPAYIELHASSAFSFLRGSSRPVDLAARAAELGLPALALCDRMGVYGAPRLHRAAAEHGLRAIVGAELAMSDGSALPVLARTAQGYRNLCRLLTNAQLRAAKGEARLEWDELEPLAGGLVALTGDFENGPLARLWGDPNSPPEAIPRRLARIERIFGRDSVYVELQRHHLREGERLLKALAGLGRDRGLPLLATGGVRYAEREGRCLADALTCLRHHTHLDAAGRLLARNGERHLKAPAEMAALFADLPEAIANTRRLADSITFSLENPGYLFPDFPVPEGASQDSHLEQLVWASAPERFPKVTPKVRAQLRHELDLIHKLGFSGYFLIVWDIVQYCRKSGILVQGRGSAANSAVCYSLGITACDPVAHKLLFERFLSEGRKGWPDIDLDLPSGELREQVIQEVYARYGRRGAAMTANVITYRGRSAVREMGKALNFPEEQINRFSDLFANGDFPQTLQMREQLRKAGIAPGHPRAHALARLAARLQGLPRHLGQHSGGMIICQGKLDTVVPLENASMPGRSVAQWDKDDCEDMGIIKVDLLGLGMMAVMQDALAMTRARGRPVELNRIPHDDPATFDLMCRADTIGVFQIESRAQQATLPRMQPRCFYDLVVEVAIIRPGPIVGRLAHPYLERRSGKEPVTYLHPDVRPVLERTLGVPLFQEQVLQIAMILADCSGSEAEELRRALNFHRDPERLERVKVKLRDSMLARGHAPETCEALIEAVGSFALYGFPESHAISFALIAYASAYLKVHYAAEFFAALLNNQPMGFYAPATLIQDARRRGLRFLPPCVNASEWPCTVADAQTVRLGLNQLRGVDRGALQRLVAVRGSRAFTSLDELRGRTGFDRDELRVLARAGALNALCGHRRQALWQVERHLVQDDLFTPAPAPEPALAAEPGEACPLEPMSLGERIGADFATTGVTVGPHPMLRVRPRLPRLWRAGDLPEGRHGERVTVGGAVICRQRPGTAKGVFFVSLEDETGVANCVIYPDLFERRRLLLTSEAFLAITGKLQLMENTISVLAERIAPLTVEGEALPEQASHDFH